MMIRGFKWHADHHGIEPDSAPLLATIGILFGIGYTVSLVSRLLVLHDCDSLVIFLNHTDRLPE